MIFQIFAYFYLVNSKNYCIEKTQGNCKKHQSKVLEFDQTFDHLPSNHELQGNSENDIFVIADNVDYNDDFFNHQKQNKIITSDSSVYLTYAKKVGRIQIYDDYIYTNYDNLKNTPIKFQIEDALIIDVYADETNIAPSIIIDAKKPNLTLTIRFFTENVKKDQIEIFDSSEKMIINELTKPIQDIVKNTDKLKEIQKTYYCISDRDEKCKDYSAMNLTYIESTSQITSKHSVIIIDTSIPQFYSANFNKKFTHFICLQGSKITYWSFYESYYNDFYVIIHDSSIEIANCIFEGKGKFTLVTPVDFYLWTTTNENNFDLTLKSREPFGIYGSEVRSMVDKDAPIFENKIKVDEKSLYYGKEKFYGLFEKGKYVNSSEMILNGVTLDNFKEYPYDELDYYFKSDKIEIPVTWKKPCYIRNYYGGDENAMFTFNDIYSFSIYGLDSFIKLPDSTPLLLRPSKYLRLLSYPNWGTRMYDIHIDHDVIVHKSSTCGNPDENPNHRCYITGKGQMKFVDEKFINEIETYCKIDDDVKLVPLEEPFPNVYVCIGQSDLEKCKAEIEGVESIQNADWVWLRNINTLYDLYKYEKAYVTDEQKYGSELRYKNIIITKNGKLETKAKELIIKKNSVNGIVAQSKTAKLTILYSYEPNKNEPLIKNEIKIIYEEAPTEIDFKIFFYYENIKLKMLYYDNYVPNSIQLDGTAVIYIRDPYQSIINMFKKPDTITFAINPEKDYQICYADKPTQCTDLDDFVFARSIQEFVDYDSVSDDSTVYLKKNISLSMNSNFYISNIYNCVDNITIKYDLPNNALVLFGYNYLEIIADRSYRFSLTGDVNKNRFIFDIKENIIMDSSNSIPYSIDFTSPYKTTEIIPSPRMLCTNHFTFPENFKITSPVPKYLSKFSSVSILQSSSWSYLYLSEEGKSLLGSVESFSFDSYNNDENLAENIVLATGKNDVLSIPLHWTKKHNVYLLQNYKLVIEKPLVLNYLKDGVVFNDNFKIISGDFNIKASDSFTINAELPKGYEIVQYMYNSQINCEGNSGTEIKTGYLNSNQRKVNKKCVTIQGYGTSNILTINLKNEADLFDFNIIARLYSGNNSVKYDFGYDYICYCQINEMSSKCSGKYYHASDISTFLAVVRDNPNVIINLYQDLIIPYSTGNNFTLNPNNENIKITLPDAPESISFKENNKIIVTYSDSTIINILSKAIINVELKKSIVFNIESTTQSLITFSLGSDVLISPESQITEYFEIPVIKNGFCLYAEDVEKFSKIFGNSIDLYKRVCAYEQNSESLCTLAKRENIDDVFTFPFEYREVEIAPISNSHNIRLPSIRKDVDVNILPNSANVLNINTASSLSIGTNIISVNDCWHFKGDKSILSFMLDIQSSLSIPEIVSTPLTLQLTTTHSIIDLKSCVAQNTKSINLIKYGENLNLITVYGSLDIYNNFKNILNQYDGIKLIRNSTQKYLCVCNDDESCNKCKQDIEGLVTTTNIIMNDPGENVEIRFFSDFEISSNIFTNIHNILIDLNCRINITNVKNVYQNIDDKLMIDNLIFENGENLLLKPRDPILNITMQTGNSGPQFTIEIDTFLKLNVPNAHEKDINSSKLYVTGNGELNIYDYPYNKIKANNTVKVIKGVYTICNSKAGNSVCSYDSAEGYKQLDNCYDFRDDFDPDSKIIVFLDSFTSSIDVNIRYLRKQKIQFMRNPNSLKLLNNNNNQQNKLRILSTTELISKSDLTTELSGSIGGAILNNSDSDLFVIGFDKELTIKQEGETSINNKPIIIQPQNENVTINVDDSVDLKKQKVKIESEKGKNVHVTVRTNKEMKNNDDINKFFDTSSSNIKIVVEQKVEKNDTNIPTKNKKKNISKGAICGILIGVCAVVGIVAVIVVMLHKRKQKVRNSVDDISDN